MPPRARSPLFPDYMLLCVRVWRFVRGARVGGLLGSLCSLRFKCPLVRAPLSSRLTIAVCAYMCGAKGEPVLLFRPNISHVPFPLPPSTPFPMKRPRLFRLVRVAPRPGGGRAVRARFAPPWAFLRLPGCENICS